MSLTTRQIKKYHPKKKVNTVATSFLSPEARTHATHEYLQPCSLQITLIWNQTHSGWCMLGANTLCPHCVCWHTFIFSESHSKSSCIAFSIKMNINQSKWAFFCCWRPNWNASTDTHTCHFHTHAGKTDAVEHVTVHSVYFSEDK